MEDAATAAVDLRPAEAQVRIGELLDQYVAARAPPGEVGRELRGGFEN